MSLILSASVVRVRDGLPLSASTDYEQSAGVQECRKYFKTLAKKLAQLPDRCTLKAGKYNINFISSLGVSYMMLCTENYPSVLSFCFLDELQKEFITTYNMMKTNTTVRPYCFIEFEGINNHHYMIIVGGSVTALSFIPPSLLPGLASSLLMPASPAQVLAAEPTEASFPCR
ncbi:UNVERIFIED_CONTAM: Vesicle-trafficking protein S22a [Gekko kuhli]